MKLKPICNLCSSANVQVRHRHFSSRFHQELCGAVRPVDKFWCVTCRRQHEVGSPTRMKLVLSSSTLNNTWESEDFAGDEVHVEYETIPGAQIPDLTNAFLTRFGNQTIPIDVVVVCGLNDVKNHDLETVRLRFATLRGVVLSNPKTNGKDFANTCTICPLLQPPQYVWYPDNGPEPPHYDNKLEFFLKINEWLAEDNSKHGMTCVPAIFKHGRRMMKVRNKSGQVERVVHHRWNHWRESVPRRMLHLVDARRVVVLKEINRYIKTRT